MNTFHKDIPVLAFESQSEFETWLEKNFEDTKAYWIKIAKKNAVKKSMTYEEAREVALMYGWIDGLLNRLDDEHYLLKFCHRRPKSNWSDINIAIVAKLISDGKIKPEGLKEFQLAQTDGRINIETGLTTD